MLSPAQARIAQVGIDVGAVKNVTRTAGVDDAFARDAERGQRMDRAGFVVPEQAALAHRDPADAANKASIERSVLFIERVAISAGREGVDVDLYAARALAADITTA
jgi:hypothetical protein